MQVTAGLDEVGIGALAGPYIAVVAVFREKDLTLLPPGVKDSKKTSEAERGMMFLPIVKAAWDVGMGHAWPWEIDRLGPNEALQLCYRRALAEIRVKYDFLIIDGNVGVRSFKGVFKPNSILVTPKADVKYREVSAASIIAKWARDEMMISYARKFPEYHWKDNKGYGTDAHEKAIKEHGLLVDEMNHARYLHRRHYTRKFTFEGVKHAGAGL